MTADVGELFLRFRRPSAFIVQQHHLLGIHEGVEIINQIVRFNGGGIVIMNNLLHAIICTIQAE